MNKIKVCSSQFNYKYGDQIHFPYSIATLVAWIKSNPELSDVFQFEKCFIFRNKIEKYISTCCDSDILLCSCYGWNWEITKKLAKRVKKINPKCIIIFGGPQVPKWYKEHYSESFFEKHDYVDILVHGEGEQIIENIFKAYLEGINFEGIKGIETKDFKGEPQPRLSDIDILPSPYLTNIVWDLVEPEDDIKYIAAWESNRGCPFKCAFCDWGSATMSKVRKRNQNKLEEEIRWFGENKIPYIDVCDANWGIFKDRDLELSRKFSEVKKQHGFPEKIRPAWAKVSSEKLIPVAKVLLEADMLRAVTLAVQSLDEATLTAVKRKNIKFKKWADLVNIFRSEGIENYTELILGLPGETIESYKNNLEQMMELFPRPVLYIYNCGVFPNAPMNEPSYKKLHDIKTISSPIFLMHSTPSETKLVEYEDIVLSTSTMTGEDLREAYLYSWVTQSFHSFGILEYVSKYFHDQYGLKYVDFYSHLIEYCKDNDLSIFSEEYRSVKNLIEMGYSGEGWEHYDSNLGEICWPHEEATFLRCAMDSSSLKEHMFSFLQWLNTHGQFNSDISILEDLSEFQVYLLTTRDILEDTKIKNFNYDWVQYFNSNGNNYNLEKKKVTYTHTNKITERDITKWCYKTAWWGRGPKKYKIDPADLKTYSGEAMSEHCYKQKYNIKGQ